MTNRLVSIQFTTKRPSGELVMPYLDHVFITPLMEKFQ